MINYNTMAYAYQVISSKFYFEASARFEDNVKWMCKELNKIIHKYLLGIFFSNRVHGCLVFL